MTNDQQTKKYLRKVTDERVADAKRRFDNMDIISVLICPKIVRGLLEADAEVIEGKKTTYALCGDGRSGIMIGNRKMGSREQFYAEWEEIP